MSALVTAPRENLTRTASFALRDTAANPDDAAGDGRTLDGYAAVFDAPTLIDSWEGTFNEEIRKGAFRKSIRERTPVMQFDHGRHPLIGSIPIGRIDELAEDDHGLQVLGRISDNWLMEPIRDAIADRTVTGMSFRFSVVREEWRDAAGKLVKPDELSSLLWDPGDRGPLTRTLIEVKLHELGPVVFPAYEQTSVDVRARSLAAEIRGDDQLRREVRAALARQAPQVPAADADDLDDPDVRRDVAKVLLFDQTRTSTETPVTGRSSEPEDRSQGAPADDGHPPATTDAPPADGHPSDTPTPRATRLRGDIREIGALMDDVLASIKE
ncbi:HK97 family phage prohead protease [Actinomadura harenae]|uniref:HK97 family phage prohead protease n=1 Tax=Actinomadura harenae TaxID=2483351 RepID=A0A3M2LQW5_9ACTN|nr:HK97 family phage prohead protease [Actinomadura harenae]RMI39884.1 HK97 family phage prohead protease [Actinomadura harenae]